MTAPWRGAVVASPRQSLPSRPGSSRAMRWSPTRRIHRLRSDPTEEDLMVSLETGALIPHPDRNLAHRTGAGDRGGGDPGRAVHRARRQERARTARRWMRCARSSGRSTSTASIVIGEGEKDKAPMLFNGEHVGNGHGPAVRHRGRPDRRHLADRGGPPERALDDRGRPTAARMLDASTRVLHGQDRHRAGGRRRRRHPQADRRQHPSAGEGEGQAGRRDRGRRCSTGRGTRS